MPRAKQGTAPSLDQIQRAKFDFIRAIDRQVHSRMVRQRRQRYAQSAGLLSRLRRGWNSNDAQALTDARRQRIENQ